MLDYTTKTNFLILFKLYQVVDSSSGTYNPSVIIDFGYLITEFNEGNNEERVEVIV
ncbi:hypothetical protein KAJ87_00245 [Candidatus Pacearchaeota archaeon]|nr:hypothetical protein [Candidatus Pacearchaeota archaeon]